MKRIFSFLLLLLSGTVVAQTNLYVDSSRAASGAGTSWLTAYKTLHEALNFAQAASPTVSFNVHIAKGTYYPTGVQSSAGRDSTFLIARNGLRVYGGYPSGGGTRNGAANLTVLSGDIGVAGDSLDNSYHVVTLSNIASAGDSTLLDGVTIAHGNASGAGQRAKGGGLWISQASARGAIQDCIIRNNAGGSGGGLYAESASLSFKNVYFTDNNAQFGGAVYLFSTPASPYFRGCTFDNNQATSEGGAVYTAPGATCSFLDGSFTHNAASSVSGAAGGGAIRAAGYLTTIRCTFTRNAAPSGGALDLTAGATIDTCTFTANKASVGNGGAIAYSQRIGSTDPLSCHNSVFHANTAHNGNGGAISNTAPPAYTSGYSGCSFTKDSARRGGAIYLKSKSNIFTSTFLSNYASGKGGAVYETQFNLGVVGCRFSGNVADTAGGALCLDSNLNTSSYLEIINTLFSGNKGGLQGGAIAAYQAGGLPFLLNCTFAGDSAAHGNGMYCDYTVPDLTNCILWEGPSGCFYNVNGSYPGDLYHCIIEDPTYASLNYGPGNSSANPAFVAPLPAAAAPTTAGDYSLTACSPAIGAGLDGYSIVSNHPKDVGGNPRLSGANIDIGAYEFPLEAVAGTITGSDSVCVGSAQMYTASVSGGVWSGSTPAIATISAAGLVTGIASGMDTVRYTVLSGGCPVTAERILMVLPAPATPAFTINNGAPVCEGKSFMATGTTAGTWHIGDTTLARIQYRSGNTASFLALRAGTTSITYTVTGSNGCTASRSLPVTIHPLPVITPITGGDTLCTGTAMQLSNTTPGGVWGKTTNSSGFTVNSTGRVSGISPGSGYATYTFTSPAGCISIDSQRIVVIAAPARTVTQAGGTLTAIQNGASYSWFECNGSTRDPIGHTGQSYTPTHSGSYGVSITNGICTVESACYSVTVQGISNVFPEGWNLFPNPTTGTVTVQTGTTVAARIVVCDISGKRLLQTRPVAPETTLDLAGWAPGLYLVTVTDVSGVSTPMRLSVSNR